MKKSILLIFLFALSFIAAIAQPQQPENKKGEGKGRIKALYIAYMTQELNLNESEAQKFWPVHGQFSAEIKSINKDANMTELGKEEAALNIRKKYNEKISKILGNERTDKFFKKDKEFRSKLVDELKDKRKMHSRENKMRKQD